VPFTYDSERNLVFVDYTNLTAEQLVAEVERVHREARLHLTGAPARVLVDVRGTTMSSEAVRALKDSTRSTGGSVERTAVVGITGLKKVLADAIARFSGTNTQYFDSKEEALAWLTRP
jgi:hypothetical protein